MFVDGVRRIDARVWIHDDDRVHAGVCASVAAGVVTVRARARGDRRRGAPSAHRPGGVAGRRDHDEHADATSSCRRVGDDPVRRLPGDPRADDRARADSWRPHHGCELVVFDGPLRGRNDPTASATSRPSTCSTCPTRLLPVLGRLGDGERTPLILHRRRAGFARWSWYLRLPGPRSHPLSGVVRCELPGVGLGAGRRAREPTRSGVPAPVRQSTAQGATGTAEPVPDRRARTCAASTSR